MPAKDNLVSGALAFKLERFSEFVPKLALQPNMVHFRTSSALSIPLREHNGTVSQQESPCIKDYYSGMLATLGQAPFKNHIRRAVMWLEFCSLKFLPSNANLYSSSKALRSGQEMLDRYGFSSGRIQTKTGGSRKAVPISTLKRGECNELIGNQKESSGVYEG